MAVVVDATAIAAIAFGEPEGAWLADRLAPHALLAPSIVDYELAQIAWRKARAHPDAARAIEAAVASARQLAITRVTVSMPELFALARQTGLTAYEAAYLWVARTYGAELVTTDRRLARWAEWPEG